MFPSEVSLLIIGAGAAGLGASEQARQSGVDHLVLEASHRIGGRGLTEMLNDEHPVDLGCHWMHCGSKNLLAGKAQKLGVPFETRDVPYRDFVDGHWKDEIHSDSRTNFVDHLYQKISKASETNNAQSVWDCIDDESRHAPWASYWLSLMHSNDPDCVSVTDHADFIDTEEDWPVKNGYGALIERCGADAPVSLNTAVLKIDYSGVRIIVETNKGTLRADKVVVTVSTGVLAAQDIEFVPALPDNTTRAIHDLPMGNYNYLFYALQPGVIPQETFSVAYENNAEATSIRLREFGRPMLSIPVAGRFAWWQESQPENAIQSWGMDIIADTFGNDARKDVTGFKRSAWGYDSWIKGAYSSARPESIGARKALMVPVNEQIWFAGEAASMHVFNTAHGAWESGQRAVAAAVSTLS